MEYTHQQRRTVIIAILLCILLAALDQTVVVPAVPAIAADLHSFGDLSWVVTAYLLTSTATTPLYGRLSDQFGRRRTLVPAIVVFVIAALLCAGGRGTHQCVDPGLFAGFYWDCDWVVGPAIYGAVRHHTRGQTFIIAGDWFALLWFFGDEDDHRAELVMIKLFALAGLFLGVIAMGFGLYAQFELDQALRGRVLRALQPQLVRTEQRRHNIFVSFLIFIGFFIIRSGWLRFRTIEETRQTLRSAWVIGVPY